MPAEKSSSFARWSLATPAISLVVASMISFGQSGGTGGDMVGWAFILIGVGALGIGGLVGVVLAAFSLGRKEPAAAIRLAGFIINALCLVPAWLARETILRLIGLR